jgi:CBS domain-containing protein
MRARMKSLEQLMPFAKAGELLAERPRPLVSVSSTAGTIAAAQIMNENDVGFLVVVEAGKPVGVLSERDLVRRTSISHATLVRDIMTTHVHKVAPEAGVPDCLAVMHRERIRHLLVMSGASIQGVLSIRDLTGSLVERHERLLRRLEEDRLIALSPNPGGY